ncbi:methionine ABC transporter ATP-binding protein [Natronoglycomyces albus]|uniref:ATP-binding cassette domain-containing protein n=1 Tax=Natronoglycomyces albus TaxID=2811108 RepID=A0A895XL48_9ACTN|nr:methionine ABC transporter ATP-binding protein [Natronoglycomyces albus]QSB06054.1 ATP-binding cassette domain-containing protein [Natronoglycomyces albus]
MIHLSGVSKSFGSTIALDAVDLHVPEGDIFGILGRSGAGKSTLLRTVNLLERPDEGAVYVNGADVTTLSARALRRTRSDIGMIFQHFNLLNNRNVVSNVALPLRLARVGRHQRQARAMELLDLVGLADKARAYPGQLSGGQRQRVAIARALASEPKVLLSDEATSALDTDTTDEILDLLAELNQTLNLTILLITHELEVITRICHHAAVMEAGRFVEQGQTRSLLADPHSRLGSSARRLASRLLGEDRVEAIDEAAVEGVA